MRRNGLWLWKPGSAWTRLTCGQNISTTIVTTSSIWNGFNLFAISSVLFVQYYNWPLCSCVITVCCNTCWWWNKYISKHLCLSTTSTASKNCSIAAVCCTSHHSQTKTNTGNTSLMDVWDCGTLWSPWSTVIVSSGTHTLPSFLWDRSLLLLHPSAEKRKDRADLNTCGFYVCHSLLYTDCCNDSVRRFQQEPSSIKYGKKSPVSGLLRRQSSCWVLNLFFKKSREQMEDILSFHSNPHPLHSSSLPYDVALTTSRY